MSVVKAITFDLWDTIVYDDSDEPKRSAQGLRSKKSQRRYLLWEALNDLSPIDLQLVESAYDVADATMRTGVLNGDSEAFPFDRFWMGGVQFGQRLRGYDETTVTPLGFFPDRSREINDIDRLGEAFFSVSTELALRVGAQLSGALFLDAGNVWRDARQIDPTRMFRGAGLGIQLVTPFGPVGLDYAYGFDKVEPGWQFHFRLGAGL